MALAVSTTTIPVMVLPIPSQELLKGSKNHKWDNGPSQIIIIGCSLSHNLFRLSHQPQALPKHL